MQFAGPVPGRCSQVPTALQVAWQAIESLQVCRALVAPEPVSWHRPAAQVCVHDAPAPHVTWHESDPAHAMVHVLFSHVA